MLEWLRRIMRYETMVPPPPQAQHTPLMDRWQREIDERLRRLELEVEALSKQYGSQQ